MQRIKLTSQLLREWVELPRDVVNDDTERKTRRFRMSFSLGTSLCLVALHIGPSRWAYEEIILVQPDPHQVKTESYQVTRKRGFESGNSFLLLIQINRRVVSEDLEQVCREELQRGVDKVKTTFQTDPSGFVTQLQGEDRGIVATAELPL